MVRTDVLIVGGGPAGATLSQFLKDKNISFLVVEKGGIMRDKICAGGVPLVVNSLLPKRLRDFSRVEYNALEIFYKNSLTAHSSEKTVFSYGVRRAEFDSYLRKGLDVRYNERFISFEENKSGIIVKTDKNVYLSKFFIGADGVGSRVSFVSGLAPKKRFIVGEEAEIASDTGNQNAIKIFIGYNFLGYGWVFPKHNFQSVGSGALKSRFKKGAVFGFYPGKYKAKIYPISLWSGPERLQSGRVALVGEAANLVDPFTAGGIYPAILSSYLLSEVIANALKNGKTSLKEYENLLKEKLYSNFQYALFLSRMFYPFLPLIKKHIVNESTINRVLELTSKGYISYKEFYERIKNSKHISLKLAYFIVKKFVK